MKFTLDARPDLNLIRSYAPGEVRIGEHTIHTNCIVTADTLVAEWPATDPSTMDPSHIAAILELKPEVVLLGTGEVQRFPKASVRNAFMTKGIGLETMTLGAACRTFNILVQEERRVAAALFLL
jgi:uncharacterized protein